jgi:hypothetical protein
MQTKLTLRLDDALVDRAKRYSKAHETSVSKLVADFFALIDDLPAADSRTLTPRVRSLVGALSSPGLTEGDHKRHLEEKHR